MIAPKATGNWTTGPFMAFLSSGLRAGSEPAKLTVADCREAMPAPEPTGLKLIVSPWDFRVDPHCW